MLFVHACHCLCRGKYFVSSNIRFNAQLDVCFLNGLVYMHVYGVNELCVSTLFTVSKK